MSQCQILSICIVTLYLNWHSKDLKFYTPPSEKQGQTRLNKAVFMPYRFRNKVSFYCNNAEQCTQSELNRATTWVFLKHPFVPALSGINRDAQNQNVSQQSHPFLSALYMNSFEAACGTARWAPLPFSLCTLCLSVTTSSYSSDSCRGAPQQFGRAPQPRAAGDFGSFSRRKKKKKTWAPP